MANQKLSALATLAGSELATADQFYVVDVSAGTAGSKSITAAEMLTGLGFLAPLILRRVTGGIQTLLQLQGTTSATTPVIVFNNSSLDILSIGSNASSGLSWLNSFDGIAFGTGSAIHASNERMRITVSGLVGIGGIPNAAALLDVASTALGFLPPRMTTTQRDAITSPPSGLVVYNSTTGKLNVRGAAAWEAVTSA